MPLVLNLPFGISVDLTLWDQIMTWGTWPKISAIFALVGWPILIIVFFYVLLTTHRWHKIVLEQKSWKWVLLAVDIPQEVLQGPKAVEHIFANLHGSALYANLAEKWWYGKYQKWFSFEIISIEGYIQFLIRTEMEYRDLVEAAIYAQYPEAEITEVEDYVDRIPHHYPDENYKLVGWEFILENSDVYPIRTYQEFEHSISKDVVFNDPMAAMLENFSRIGPGENFWYHIIILPSIDERAWKEKGIAEAKKIIADQGAKPHKDSLISKIGDIPRLLAKEVISAWDWNWEAEESAKHDSAKPASIMDLTPGLRDTLQSVEEKISKHAFKTKIRVLYAARKEVFNLHKCMEGFIGSMKQFFNTNRNGFKPTGFTMANYAFANYRANYKRNEFIHGFRKRKPFVGHNPIMLNVEELATIWHFPLAFVKTPLLQKTTSKRAEPPTDLPVEDVDDIYGLPTDEDPGLIISAKPPTVITDAHGSMPTEEKKSDDDHKGFSVDQPYG